MKKIIILTLSCIFCLIFGLNSKIYAKQTDTFKTSDGIEFSTNDLIIYYSDFENIKFDSEQDYIDYIYNVGYNRVQSVTYDDYSQISIFGHKLTADEINLFKNNVSKIPSIISCKDKAISKTLELYDDTSDDTKANAFQHAYWVMLMYFNVGHAFAIDEAYAHENYVGNEEKSKGMDIYNDDIAYNVCSSITYTSDDALATEAKFLQTSGELIYIKRDYKYVSQKIIYSNGKVVLKYSTGDFYCYTNSNIPYEVPATIVINEKYDIMQGSLMEV